jgi:hypothetical protein
MIFIHYQNLIDKIEIKTNNNKTIKMENTNCPICYVDIDNKDSIKLSCGHCYHKSCINKAVYIFEDETTTKHEIKPCPYCRNILTPIDKKNTITGEQFTRIMQYILENIEVRHFGHIWDNHNIF